MSAEPEPMLVRDANPFEHVLEAQVGSRSDPGETHQLHVEFQPRVRCSCAGNRRGGEVCWHIKAALLFLSKEELVELLTARMVTHE